VGARTSSSVQESEADNISQGMQGSISVSHKLRPAETIQICCQNLPEEMNNKGVI
jgi:hypothetical protein